MPKQKIVITLTMEYDELGYWHGELRYPFRDKGFRILASCFGDGDHFFRWVGYIVENWRGLVHDAEMELRMMEEDKEDAESRPKETEAGRAANVAQDSGRAVGADAEVKVLRIDSASGAHGHRASGD